MRRAGVGERASLIPLRAASLVNGRRRLDGRRARIPRGGRVSAKVVSPTCVAACRTVRDESVGARARRRRWVKLKGARGAPPAGANTPRRLQSLSGRSDEDRGRARARRYFAPICPQRSPSRRAQRAQDHAQKCPHARERALRAGCSHADGADLLGGTCWKFWGQSSATDTARRITVGQSLEPLKRSPG